MKSALTTQYKKIAVAQTTRNGTFEVVGGTNYLSIDGNNFSDSGIPLNGSGHTVWVFRTIDDTYTRIAIKNHAITAIDLPNNEVILQLFLDDNDLQAVPESLYRCPNLEELTIERNNIVDILPIPEFCRQLQKIRLDNNDIEIVPESFGELTDLVELYIPNHPKITSLPASLGNLTKLENFGFINCSLSQLPDEIFQITSLLKIFLSSNQLTEISPLIGNLTNLRKLDLQDNNLTTIPSQIGLLSTLDHLNLQRNPFSVVPNEIGNLVNLTFLSLGDSTITTLPDLSTLTKLETLRVMSSDITELPAWITSMPNIRSLNLNSCLFPESNIDAALKLLYDNRATFTQSLKTLNIQTQRTGDTPTGNAGDAVAANTGEGWITGLSTDGWNINR